ncbi:GNAT family N-acetyltransferase [Halobacillus karajensis]|uniref:Aminoalkylphosphonic acid N-acetyltransferase n=1 Tax=Halobacillus karajensis TaxID=195088 RepID=A0A024P8X9_9BACI|nr:GNAT family N-acetyltransferase [Halobacillus karajensis]CDQ20059.1 aminoalkylphosphonic acid N-acetyltransferase [Halobacillus karajensis]CDQ25278.1 aminoalkylphosphonic acid N-acetyltransferase [Halobacillus karajensis]CDQ28361.1 aminoalkylphosphonic acid N-acetyltransferase [Halobacillus karajensis]
MCVSIKKASLNDALLVAEMAAGLFSEMSERTVCKKELLGVCEELLNKENHLYTVFLAFKEEECIGMISVHEVTSLYARGSMGIIQELYVRSDMRSDGLGDKLIQAVKEQGFKCGWKIIEVGAPNPEKWSRTVSFYKRMGFEEKGPRLRFKLT